jgi:hypothetical protein
MYMKHALIAVLLFAAALVNPVAEAETMAYPTRDAPSFLIDYPASWEMTPGEELGDYTSLLGTSGTGLMLRTVTVDDVEQAIKDTIEYVYENYTDVQLSEPTKNEHRGLQGFYIRGTATDSESGPMRLGMAWYRLKDGSIGEVWFSAPEDDAEGIEEAGKILESFRVPE